MQGQLLLFHLDFLILMNHNALILSEHILCRELWRSSGTYTIKFDGTNPNISREEARTLDRLVSQLGQIGEVLHQRKCALNEVRFFIERVKPYCE